MKYEQYEHHGRDMWVRSDLKGKHREYCMCHSCKRFKPENREDNCPIANVLYRLCVLLNLTTPVWECERFERKD